MLKKNKTKPNESLDFTMPLLLLCPECPEGDVAVTDEKLRAMEDHYGSGSGSSDTSSQVSQNLATLMKNSTLTLSMRSVRTLFMLSLWDLMLRVHTPYVPDRPIWLLYQCIFF